MTKTKRKNTRDQILARLADNGWERTGIDDDTDWWVDEHWTIRSVRQEYGLTLVMSFLVDPQYEGHDKSSAVWMITAATQYPENRLDEQVKVADLDLQKGRLGRNLAKFIEEIDRYRNSEHQRTETPR